MRGIEEIEISLERFGFGELFNEPKLMEDYLTSFSFDKKNACIWCWDISEYIDNAVMCGYITEQEREDFLIAYLLGV